MLSLSRERVRERAEAFARALGARRPRLRGRGGATAPRRWGAAPRPTLEVDTALVAVTHAALRPSALLAGLRAGDPPVLARVAEDRLLLDLRTVAPEDDELRDACCAALAHEGSIEAPTPSEWPI